LAEKLVQALAGTNARVIDFATGSGRNAAALRAAGLDVLAIADTAASAEGPKAANGPYKAVLSTHGLLHGDVRAIEELVEAIAGVLEPRGLFYATFGSTRDARFGTGTEIAPFVYAPDDGDERGIAHAYFDEGRLRTLLIPWFEIDALEERNADETAGAWAHTEKPLEGSAHWFVRARKRFRLVAADALVDG